MNITAVERARKQKSWTISLGDQLSATCADGSSFSLSREEAIKKVFILDGLIARRTVSFKKPVKKTLQMDSQSFNAFGNWLGYKPMLKILIKQQFSWIFVLGILYILGSLPIPGDAHAGTMAIPFKPVDMGLGLTLIFLGLFSRRFPDRIYFLIDSAWVFILSIMTFLNQLKDNSTYGLFFLLLQLSIVVSGIITWQRLGEFEERPAQEFGSPN